MLFAKYLKYGFLILGMLLLQGVFGQKEPQYTQYMYNIGSFNPAYAGSVENTEFIALYRAQWLDIPGAPRTLRFGGNLPLGHAQMGAGFNLVNDGLGPSNQTFIDFSYSYQVNLSGASWLSFGLNAGGSLLNVDFSEGSFNDATDPSVANSEINNFYPIVGTGLFMYAREWYVGLSVPNLLTQGIYNEEVAMVVEDDIQLNFIGGYVFQLSDNLKFKPAFLLNYLNGSPLNVNLSANFLFSNRFTLGTSYRIDNAFSGVAGFQISDAIYFGYSYDLNTNGLGQYNNGSHEAILKFSLESANPTGGRNQKKDKKQKGKQIDSPRFF